MLFIIAVDVLQKMIQGANTMLIDPISAKLSDLIMALQYADDTAIIANGQLSTVVTLKLVLRIFSKVSGLDINFGKSCFVPISISQEQQT